MNNMSTIHRTGSHALLREYFDPDSVRVLLSFYVVDYERLNLSVPEWAVEMVGVPFVKSLGLRPG